MDTLSQIVDYKKTVIASAKKNLQVSQMNNKVNTPNFADAILTNHAQNKTSIIAEIKQGSPSRGIITTNFDVKAIAEDYQKGGATCISVLTDEKFFLGSNKNIAIASLYSRLPILRKDFIIDEYQIHESLHLGASAILLIASILTPQQMQNFETLAFALGLSVLVEVHSAAEMETALKYTTTPLIGINNRNLKNFSINLQNTIDLLQMIPQGRIAICESGITTKDDISMMKSHRCNTFLIGTAIMQSTNRMTFIQNLLQ